MYFNRYDNLRSHILVSKSTLSFCSASNENVETISIVVNKENQTIYQDYDKFISNRKSDRKQWYGQYIPSKIGSYAFNK